MNLKDTHNAIEIEKRWCQNYKIEDKDEQD